MELKRLTVYSPFLCYFILEKIFISHCVFFSERELLDTLPFAIQCPIEDVELIRYLYENRVKKVFLSIDI